MALRFIHLEDDPNDRDLVANALREDGIVCTIEAVATRDAFERALERTPDLILADMSLPGFDGIGAQTLAQARHPRVPFVYVSGSMGEEIAVERLKSGATDYVLKHRLEKLSSAVRRALQEAEDRRQRGRAEEDLRQLNAELETRVADRTRALKEANEALVAARRDAERANLAKSEFLSRMSHDLRTPLNAILGFAQLLQMEHLNEDQAESVKHILRGGQHLLELVNEVLDIARIESGRLSLSTEPIALAEIIESAVDLIRPLATKRGLTIEVEPPLNAFARADRQRLNQILFNLLSNAVKYNRSGGVVRVSSGAEGDRVSIVVSDTGAGIPPEKLGSLFMPFERLGAEQLGIEGTGLGLALAKALAEAMQGSLTVTSVIDVGSSFRVQLPACAPVALRDEPVRSRIRPNLESIGTVLYIEDNLSNLRLMERLLQTRPGVTLLHARDGGTGVSLAQERHPDLVFLDVHLPNGSGEVVLRQFWENPATRTIPVVILSADATPAQKRLMLASGAIAYLTKPFNIDEVLRVIDQTLGTQVSARR